MLMVVGGIKSSSVYFKYDSLFAFFGNYRDLFWNNVSDPGDSMFLYVTLSVALRIA